MDKRKSFMMCILLIFTVLQVFAQKAIQPNLKFGAPTQQEMEVAACPYDADAKAMVLCSITDVMYTYAAGSFKMEYTFKKRIKVLSQDGTDVANVSIPYYASSNGAAAEERIRSIKATAYNMVDGKMVKTKMGNDLVFEERLDKKHMLTKFTIPQVKAGTIIEYQYVKSSDFFYQIDNWYAQEDIPVLYTSYEIEIPDILVFSLEQSGAAHLQNSIQPNSRRYIPSSDPLLTKRYVFKGENLPAIKGDKYVWCPEMYAAQVGFELRSIEIPGALYKNFTSTWKDIDDTLMADDDFGGRIKRSNPLKEEMAAARLDTITDFTRKVAATYLLLKKHVKWNGHYALLGNSSRNVLKEGKASNADLNFLLMNMLNSLNIKTVPLVLRTRNRGNLPLSHPSIESINTFVVGICENDTSMLVMDGSAAAGYVGVLPPKLLTNAHMVGGDQVSLMATANYRVNCVVKAEIGKDGKLHGTMQKRYQDLAAMMKKRAFLDAKDSAEYVKEIAADIDANILRYKLKGVRKYSPQADQLVEFEKDGELADVIYLNPVLDLPFSKVPFTAEERTMPVEFDSPMSSSYIARIKLPAGYTLEEIPSPVFLRNEDKSIAFKMQIQLMGDVLVANYSFHIRKPLFIQAEYPGLKAFMEDVYNKVKTTVVLKKTM